jgi:hypothetical protein
MSQTCKKAEFLSGPRNRLFLRLAGLALYNRPKCEACIVGDLSQYKHVHGRYVEAYGESFTPEFLEAVESLRELAYLQEEITAKGELQRILLQAFSVFEWETAKLPGR